MDVALLFGRGVTLLPVGMHGASRLNRLLMESHQAVTGSIWNLLHPNPPYARTLLLGGYNN